MAEHQPDLFGASPGPKTLEEVAVAARLRQLSSLRTQDESMMDHGDGLERIILQGPRKVALNDGALAKVLPSDDEIDAQFFLVVNTGEVVGRKIFSAPENEILGRSLRTPESDRSFVGDKPMLLVSAMAVVKCAARALENVLSRAPADVLRNRVTVAAVLLGPRGLIRGFRVPVEPEVTENLPSSLSVARVAAVSIDVIEAKPKLPVARPNHGPGEGEVQKVPLMEVSVRSRGHARDWEAWQAAHVTKKVKPLLRARAGPPMIRRSKRCPRPQA